MTNKPLVIDIYHGDPITDFQAVKDSGIVGTIHKAYEAGVPDKFYASRRKAFTDIGMKWGAYCFFHGRDKGGDPIKEADAFLTMAEPDADTLIALDWETDESGYVPHMDEAKAFLYRIAEKLNRKAVVYSGNVAKEKIIGSDLFLGSHRLWLAQYGAHWSTQASWERPWLWQNNGDNTGPGPHHIPGVSGLCDNNTVVSPMTVDDLLGQWAT